MTCRWGRLSERKMILSGLLLMLILIRHTLCSYQDGYKPSWSVEIKPQHHQAILLPSRIEQHPLSLPHPHRHHREYIHNSNREMHTKSQLHSHFNSDRDYQARRPATRPTTTTARTVPRTPNPATRPTTTTARTVPRTPNADNVAWKWSSSTAANLRLAELTHISYQGGNETSAGSTAFKNRLSSDERQQWSAKNKQIYSAPLRVKIKSNVLSDTSITKPSSSHVNRSSWSHYRPVQQQQHAEPNLRVEDNHRTLLWKTPRIVEVDPDKISHEDESEGVKIKSDNKDDYDYYYDGEDENEEATSVNKIEETKSRHQNVADDFNFDYLDDEPNPQIDDQNTFKTESLTEEKWKNYGTAEAVEKSRRRYTNEGQSAATAHIQRIKEESKCRWPHPKVIPVTEASKRFVPHCTILHRCGDDTGCCDSDTKTCVAKTTMTVHLHFFVIPLGGPASVEVRSFVNHTECHCVDRCLLSSCADSGGVRIINSSGDADETTGLSSNGTCRCPSHFNVDLEEFSRGRCRCDCYSHSNEACHILKRGQDGFMSEDQNCISDEKCQTPTCQYGRYNTYSGRCPKVKHQKRTISRYHYR